MLCKCPSWSDTTAALSRKKSLIETQDTELARVLTTFDLTTLGVGSTLGVGVYVLAGDVAKNTAGPAVVISFFVAAVASILAGLCYAEFGARVPKAGSAYVYSYVCIGEFFAFVIGWNLILEYLIGSATVTKAIFLYIDELANNTMTSFFEEYIPLGGNQVSNYADVFSLGLSLLFSVALACGAKESSMVNNIFTITNISVVLLVIISGLWKVDVSNWNKTKADAHGKGIGGFAPYGIRGIIKGAARCFYGFIGFDCIATASEESKTPQKSIPISIVMSLLIVFLAYFGMSTILTMMLPYYEQDENAPLPYIYNKINWQAIKYIVSVGAICGLFSSLLGAMFPLPRIIYAMASDGLLFKSLGKVHSHFHTPFIGTLIAGTLAGVLACIFELTKLTEMMSIGTLLAYSIVAACVLVLRYSINSADKKHGYETSTNHNQYIKYIFRNQFIIPNSITQSIVSWEIVTYFFLCFLLSGLMTLYEENLYDGSTWLISICSVLAFLLICLLILISFQPISDRSLGFSVPFIPWIPGISIFINIYLMTNIQRDTWFKYGYWVIIGLVIYFSYGIWYSTERKHDHESNRSTHENRGDVENVTNKPATKLLPKQNNSQ